MEVRHDVTGQASLAQLRQARIWASSLTHRLKQLLINFADSRGFFISSTSSVSLRGARGYGASKFLGSSYDLLNLKYVRLRKLLKYDFAMIWRILKGNSICLPGVTEGNVTNRFIQGNSTQFQCHMSFLVSRNSFYSFRSQANMSDVIIEIFPPTQRHPKPTLA